MAKMENAYLDVRNLDTFGCERMKAPYSWIADASGPPGP
jgi:hypothetical protein